MCVAHTSSSAVITDLLRAFKLILYSIPIVFLSIPRLIVHVVSFFEQSTTVDRENFTVKIILRLRPATKIYQRKIFFANYF